MSSPRLSSCPVLTSSPKSTCKKSATPSIKPTEKLRRGSTSKVPAPPSRVSDKELTLSASTEDRLSALFDLLEGEDGQALGVTEDARPGQGRSGQSRESARQKVALKAGISQELGKKVNKMVKDMGVKNLSSSIQGDQVRVTGKQRDDLQTAIAFFKEADLDVPLQFTNFRD